MYILALLAIMNISANAHAVNTVGYLSDSEQFLAEDEKMLTDTDRRLDYIQNIKSMMDLEKTDRDNCDVVKESSNKIQICDMDEWVIGKYKRQCRSIKNWSRQNRKILAYSTLGLLSGCIVVAGGYAIGMNSAMNEHIDNGCIDLSNGNDVYERNAVCDSQMRINEHINKHGLDSGDKISSISSNISGMLKKDVLDLGVGVGDDVIKRDESVGVLDCSPGVDVKNVLRSGSNLRLGSVSVDGFRETSVHMEIVAKAFRRLDSDLSSESSGFGKRRSRSSEVGSDVRSRRCRSLSLNIDAKNSDLLVGAAGNLSKFRDAKDDTVKVLCDESVSKIERCLDMKAEVIDDDFNGSGMKKSLDENTATESTEMNVFAKDARCEIFAETDDKDDDRVSARKGAVDFRSSYGDIPNIDEETVVMGVEVHVDDRDAVNARVNRRTPRTFQMREAVHGSMQSKKIGSDLLNEMDSALSEVNVIGDTVVEKEEDDRLGLREVDSQESEVHEENAVSNCSMTDEIRKRLSLLDRWEKVRQIQAMDAMELLEEAAGNAVIKNYGNATTVDDVFVDNDKDVVYKKVSDRQDGVHCNVLYERQGDVLKNDSRVDDVLADESMAMRGLVKLDESVKDMNDVDECIDNASIASMSARSNAASNSSCVVSCKNSRIANVTPKISMRSVVNAGIVEDRSAMNACGFAKQDMAVRLKDAIQGEVILDALYSAAVELSKNSSIKMMLKQKRKNMLGIIDEVLTMQDRRDFFSVSDNSSMAMAIFNLKSIQVFSANGVAYAYRDVERFTEFNPDIKQHVIVIDGEQGNRIPVVEELLYFKWDGMFGSMITEKDVRDKMSQRDDSFIMKKYDTASLIAILAEHKMLDNISWSIHSVYYALLLKAAYNAAVVVNLKYPNQKVTKKFEVLHAAKGYSFSGKKISKNAYDVLS